MHIKIKNRTLLSTAVATALFGSTLSSVGQAALTSGTTLSFTLGTVQVVACTYGTTPPCAMMAYNITDVVGSYFSMDTNSNGPEPKEKTPIASFNGILIGTTQAATGSHTGPITGGEGANIDSPWTFFGSTGMHQTTAAITALTQTSNGATMDLSGWNVNWNGINFIPVVPTGTVSMACTPGSSCSDTSSYTLDGAFHVSSIGASGFTSVDYTLHLEGSVAAPAATPIVCGTGTLATANCGNGVCDQTQVDVLTGNIADTGFSVIGNNYYDFECQATGTTTGQTIDVALTLGAPIANNTGAEFRRFDGAAWGTHPDTVETGDSATSGGNCDVATTTWVAGINLGHDCAKVTLADNDAFDTNPADGTIGDPGYLALPTGGGAGPNLSSSTSGCSISRTPTSPLQGGAWILLAGFAGLLACKRKKHQQ